MSTRNKILIIGQADISLLERLKREISTNDIILIKDLKDFDKKDIDTVIKIEPLKIPILSSVRSIDMGDMGNAYPMPHKSSKRSKKW